MANVSVKFNNKDYLLSCDDGQEEELVELTNHLNSRYLKLKTMSNKVTKMNKDIDSLTLEKNQLLREKKESEKNFQALSQQHQE